jgi:hypothetical protein
MEDLRGRAFMERKLRSHYIRYGGVAALFLIALSAALLLRNHAATLDDTAQNLADLKLRVMRAQTTVDQVKGFLGRAGAIFPPNLSTEPPSRVLYGGLDKARAIMGKVRTEVGKIEMRGAEAAIPVTITGPMDDYRTVVDGIGRLQAMSFPFFNVTGFSLKTDKGEGGQGGAGVAFEVRGALCTPLMNGGPEGSGTRQPQGE